MKPLKINDKFKETVHGKVFNHTIIALVEESKTNPLMYVTRFFVKSKNRWCFELIHHDKIELFVEHKLYSIIKKKKRK